MKAVTWTRKCIQAGVVCLALLTALPVGAQPPDPSLLSQLVVYLEVPSDATGTIELSVDGISLIGRNDTVSLSPLVTEISVDDLRDRQIRLIDETIEPGQYDTLLVQLSSVLARIGPAMVSPGVSDDGYAVMIDLGAEANRTHAVFLEWPGRRLRPDDTTFVLDWRRMAVAPPPFGSLIFVTNEGSHNMSVVDRADYRVKDVIRTGQGPRDVVYSLINRQLFVANAASNEISVIDALSRQPLRTIGLLFGDAPTRLALSPDERYLHVLNYGSRTLVILDTRSFTQVVRHQVGFGPHGLAVDPRTGTVYVADEDSDDLVAYDPIALQEVPKVFPTGGAPSELVIDEQGEQLFMASGARRRLNVYNLATSAQTQTIKLCSPPAGLAYDPITQRLYASLTRCEEISIMQPEDGIELHTVGLDFAPGLIELDSERRNLLITAPDEQGLAIMSTTRRKVVTMVPVGDQPFKAIAPR